MTVHIDVSERDACVTFDAFDLDAYRTFVRAKQVPEKRLVYDWNADRYELRMPRRFAAMLDPAAAVTECPAEPLADHLFDYQAWIVERALRARRFAAWLDTGLGKTAVFLEFARQVLARTGGRVLIFSPLSVLDQTIAEWRRWYAGTRISLQRIDSREALAQWCTKPGRGLAICNYEKLIPGILNELRHLAGLILDESSILKTGGGVIKWNLIKSARGVEYKLSCTATPAPNDTMEYASQAAFLETIRHEGEVLWTWFTRDKRGVWSVKPHGRKAFYRWMSSWSIYLRDPARFGWRDVLADLPEPITIEEKVPLTDAQRTERQRILVDAGADMFATQRLGVRERGKLAQIARGFIYESSGAQRSARRIRSLKPERVAELVREEVAAGRPTIVWTVFDEEAAIVAELLRDLRALVVDGSVPDYARYGLIGSFLAGQHQALITKPQVAGYGLNLQRAQAMVFSGFDDSQERMYQAVRRAYRFGQTERVRVHVPYVPELEGLMFENIATKEARFEAEVAEQEAQYLEVLREELVDAV